MLLRLSGGIAGAGAPAFPDDAAPACALQAFVAHRPTLGLIAQGAPGGWAAARAPWQFVRPAARGGAAPNGDIEGPPAGDDLAAFATVNLSGRHVRPGPQAAGLVLRPTMACLAALQHHGPATARRMACRAGTAAFIVSGDRGRVGTVFLQSDLVAPPPGAWAPDFRSGAAGYAAPLLLDHPLVAPALRAWRGAAAPRPPLRFGPGSSTVRQRLP